MKVVFLGSGNLATRLSLEMKRKGFDIRQVYSHTPAHAEQLANRLQCKWTYLPGKVEIDADLYIFALKDTTLKPLIARITPNNGLWVHTAGSMPMDVFKGHAARYGVLYPMQTFSKERAVMSASSRPNPVSICIWQPSLRATSPTICMHLPPNCCRNRGFRRKCCSRLSTRQPAKYMRCLRKKPRPGRPSVMTRMSSTSISRYWKGIRRCKRFTS